VCELLAMSARYPTTIHLSMAELGRHGGGTGPHVDGWGIGFVQDGDALVVREPSAASESSWLAFLQDQDPRSQVVLAHIRRATRGDRVLRNTQPFGRELGGRMHLFAHNGMVHAIAEDGRFATSRFRPIGDTDSERAFCALLERLASRWQAGPPSLDERLAVIIPFAAELRELGPANFLYTDGDVIFAHGHRRKSAAGAIEPPGLHLLCRRCAAVTDHVALTGLRIPPRAEQEVALVASVPLSNEGWEPLAEGEVVVLEAGRVIRRVRPA